MASRCADCRCMRSKVKCGAVRLLRNPAENDTTRQRWCPLTIRHLSTSLTTWLKVRPPEVNTPTNHVVSWNRVDDRRTLECQAAAAAAPLNRWWVCEDASAGPAIPPVTRPAITNTRNTLRMRLDFLSGAALPSARPATGPMPSRPPVRRSGQGPGCHFLKIPGSRRGPLDQACLTAPRCDHPAAAGKQHHQRSAIAAHGARIAVILGPVASGDAGPRLPLRCNAGRDDDHVGEGARGAAAAVGQLAPTPEQLPERPPVTAVPGCEEPRSGRSDPPLPAPPRRRSRSDPAS